MTPFSDSRRSHVRLLFAAAVVVALSACGGGGGDTHSASPAPAPTAPSPTPPAPAPAPPVSIGPQISAGTGFSLALRTNGTVASWGDQELGQLGNDRISGLSQREPQTVLNLADAVRVGAGEFHAVALRSNGTVMSWGSNTDGKLGIGSSGGLFPTPQTVAVLSGVTAIAVGLDHSLALRSDGTVWAWGENDVGQLGQGDTQPRATPTQVPGLGNVTAISAGGAHSLAIRADGSVMAWGWNVSGQLGLGTVTDMVSTPTRVTALDNRGVVEITGGGAHTLARIGQGVVLGWGSNSHGQTGSGIPGTGNVLAPTVVANVQGATALAAGATHSMVLRNDGTIRTWGNASSGRLGNGTDGVTQSTSVPQVPNVGAVIAIAAGVSHSLVLVQDGSVGCFGSNFLAQCGRIEITDLTTPVEVGPGFNVGN